MIVKIRLEADGKSLKEVIADIEQIAKRLPPDCDDLQIHDEHYERVHDTCFKGRRVLGSGPKPGSGYSIRPTAIGSASGGQTGITFNAGGAA